MTTSSMSEPEQLLLTSAATAYASSKDVLISLLAQYDYQWRVIENPETGEEFDVYAVHPDYAQAYDAGHYDPDTHTWDDTVDNPLPCSVLPLGFSLAFNTHDTTYRTRTTGPAQPEVYLYNRPA